MKDGSINNDRMYAWEPINDDLNDDQICRLEIAVMITLVEHCFDLHTFTFNGKIFLNGDSGPVGADVTRAVAESVMRYMLERAQDAIRTVYEFLDDWPICVDDTIVIIRIPKWAYERIPLTDKEKHWIRMRI